MAKLFVINATQATAAIIIRRGPTRWYHLIQWDTSRDVFVHGAWMKARIYEDKCDLSPDGRLFLYFVHKGSRIAQTTTDSWTAVSRAPWLHALTIWPQGTTYYGGGRFVDNRTLILRGVCSNPLPESLPSGLQILHGTPPCQEKSKEEPESDWCGKDHDGYLVFSRGDRLFRRTKTGDKLIADFSDLVPQPEPSPDWATKPLM